VIYGFLATSWAGGFGGLVLIVFVIRHCGEGSAALQLRAFGPPGFHPKYLGRLVQRVLAIDRPPAKEKYMSKKVLILTDGGRDFA
jgi:hypothetical protein